MPKTFAYDIVERQTNEHRPGHLTLLIEGVETELTVDPAQFKDRALREAAKKQGVNWDDVTASIDPKSPKFGTPLPTLDAAKLALDVDAYQRAAAEHVLNRKAHRLRLGRLASDGKPRSGISGLGDTELLGTEEQAVDRYLNRGRLKGLDRDQRKKRKAERDAKRDHTAEWVESRAKLLARREADLKEWQEKLAQGHPKAPRNVAILEAEIKRMKSQLIVAATHGFQFAYSEYALADTDWPNDDMRIVPCMTNTTVDTERDAKDEVSDFTTLDEFDGSGYTTGGNALDNQSVNIDDSNDRAELDCDDEVRSSLAAGTRSIQGELVIRWNSTLSNSMPLHWVEYATNKTPDGSNFTVQINAEGLIQIADG